MQKVVIISDFIEGQPIAASVRYSHLMRHIKNNYSTVVISNKKNGDFKSFYADEDFKYTVTNSRYTQTVHHKVEDTGILYRLLRTSFVLKLWRMYSYNERLFYWSNKKVFREILQYLAENKVECIYATVPDIYALFVIKLIRSKHKDIPIIVELRDIINNKIGVGNPVMVLKRAESLIYKHSDGIIALTDEIAKYYRPKSDLDIRIVKNGYEDAEFDDCTYKPLNMEKEALIFSHIGSIYKGRNVKDFIEALIIIGEKLDKKVIFNIVGYLDNEALDDVNKMISKVKDCKVEVRVTGALPHKEAITYLKKTDISVILTHKRGSEYAIPGKTFEYVGACKPTIAVTHDKALIDFLHGKFGECAVHDVNCIVEAIMELMAKEYDFSKRLKYSRQRQIKNIIRFCTRQIISKKKNDTKEVLSIGVHRNMHMGFMENE